MDETKLNVKGVMDKGKDKKRSMDVRERAVFSAYEQDLEKGLFADEQLMDGQLTDGQYADGNADLNIDTHGIQPKDRAASLGFFSDTASWIHFLHENVDFNINGTRFKGKESYQVRGGVVDLGKGLVLDMNSVTLIGRAGNEAYAKNKENVQFVYVSRKYNEMYKGEVSTKVNDVFSENHIPPLEGTIEGGIKINEDQKLMDGSVTITEEGLSLKDGYLTTKMDEHEYKVQMADAKIGANAKDESGIDVIVTEPSAPEKKEDPSNINKHKSDDSNKDVNQDQTNDSKNGTDQDQINNLNNGIIVVPVADLDSNQEEENLEDDNISFSKSKEVSVENEKSVEGETEEQEKEITLEDYIEAFIKENYKSVAGTRIKWIQNALKGLLNGENPPKLTDDEKDQMKITGQPEKYIPDVEMSFSILPWLKGYISLEPNFQVGVDLGVGFNVGNMDEAKNKAGELATSINDPSKRGAANDLMVNLLAAVEVDAGVVLALKGSISAKVALGLMVGLGSLFSASSDFYAMLQLSGGSDNEILKGSLDTQKLNLEEILKGNLMQEVLSKGFTAKFAGGIGIEAAIGGEIKLESEILEWEKSWEQDFATWDIGSVRYEKEADLKPGASPSDITFVKSAFSAEAFGKSLQKESNTYGFKFSPEAIEIDRMLKESKAESEEAKEIIEAFSELQNKNLNDVTKDDWEKIEKRLIKKELTIKNKWHELQNVRNSDGLKESTANSAKDAQEGIDKHQSRLDRMKAIVDSWNEKDVNQNLQGEISESAKRGAFLIYSVISSGSKGMERYTQKMAKEKAQQQIGTRERLLEYEKDRLSEVNKDYKKHIAFINNYISSKPEEDKYKATDDFANQYIKNAGEAIYHVLSQYASVDQLKEYEEGRIKNIGEKHQTRLKELEQKAEDLKITDKLSEKNQEFLDFYKDKLEAKRILGDPFAYAIDIDALIDMEKKLMKQEKKTAKQVEIYDTLEKLNQTYSNSKTTEKERKEIDKNARNIVFKSGLYTFKDYQKYVYKSLTVDDLIEYEQRKTDEIQEMLYREIDDKKALMKSVDRTSLIEYLFTNKNREKIIKESVDIDTLIGYENDRHRAYYKDKKYKDAENHHNRVDALTEKYDIAMKLDDEEERQEMFREIRKDYFSGAIDAQGHRETSKNSKKANMGFLNAAVSGNKDTLKYIDRSVTQALVESALTMSQKIGHRAHYNDLMKLKELKKQEELGKISNAEIWAIYRDRGAGKGFKRDYLAKHKNDKEEDVTTPQLFRYIDNRLGKKLRDIWIRRQMMSLAQIFKNKFSGEEGSLESTAMGALGFSAVSREEFAALMEGGGLQRIRSLVRLKNQEEFQRLNPEERKKALATFYKSGLQGDKIIKNYYKKHIAEYLTPEKILEYERSRFSQTTEKHQKRLDLLMDPSIPENEKSQKYRLLAITDGEGNKGKVNFALSLFNDNYKTGADKAFKDKIGTILTPAFALEFETKGMEKVSRKHQERINMLEKSDLTDQEAWEKYRLMGGSRFLETFKSQIESAQKAIYSKEYQNGAFSYEQIIEHEQNRLQFYQDQLKQAQSPFVKLDEQIKEMTEYLEIMKKAIETCKSMRTPKTATVQA